MSDNCLYFTYDWGEYGHEQDIGHYKYCLNTLILFNRLKYRNGFSDWQMEINSVTCETIRGSSEFKEARRKHKLKGYYE